MRYLPVAALNEHRDAEKAADRYAVNLAATTGYDPTGIYRYIQRTQLSESPFSPLPEREQRLVDLAEAISTTRPVQRSSGAEFLEMKKALAAERPPRKVPSLRR